MPGTESTRETVTATVHRNVGLRVPPQVVDSLINQLMYLFPDPDWDQMSELINLAYGLGWKDREASLVSEPLKQPPTVTVQHTPGVGVKFLYDGKPRP